jgi:ABC-type cobalamin/Fe3+-siderophores transport system ATPase subunit
LGFATFLRYNDILLKDISFPVAAGELVALIGPNGCGKTTLLGALLGILPPNSGSVILFGQPLATLNPKREQNHHLRLNNPRRAFP